jgi:hypothetical protein
MLFPPIDLTLLALPLSGVTGGVLLLLLTLGMKQPVLWRLGLRQLLRRSSQTLLLLGGLSLSAAVMTASLGLWESLPSVGVVSGKHLFGNAVDQQFYWLLPLLSILLVGAGLLLLTLLVVLMAAERRAELGMSRALGLQRGYLTQQLLFEGAGYGLVAVVVGIPLGLVLTWLELEVLASLHPGGVFTSGGKPVQISFAVRLDWQYLVIAGCLSLLATLFTVWLAALWVSRLSIVTAMRDLDGAPRGRSPLRPLLRALWQPPVDAIGQPILETRAARCARRMEAASGVLWGIWVRGPCCLLAGGVLLLLAPATGQLWLVQLAVALLLAGLGLLVGWLLPLLPVPRVPPALARRLGFSLIGVGWLVSGLQLGSAFLLLFQPLDLGVTTRPPSALELLLGMLLPVLGLAVLALTNADLLGALLTLLLRHLRGFAPLSRTSLAYPLTFRFRTGLTVVLLSLVTFLAVLLVTTDLGALQEEQSAASTGGFQLEVDLHSNTGIDPMTPPAQLPAIQSHHLLGQDFSAVGLLRPLFYPPQSKDLYAPHPIRLDLAGHPAYPDFDKAPLVADSAFLSTTTLPMLARARGYTSDTQVWAAVRDHPGDAVLQFVANLGLPTDDGFAPFTAEVPDGPLSVSQYHPVRIIGILPSGTEWRALFLSQRTAAQMVQPPFTGLNTYLFRLQPGVNLAQATQDLRRTLVLAPGSTLDFQSFDQLVAGMDQTITSVLLLVQSGYLVLGLLFGALTIGVIASRAVVERRQQIGLLRALGFSQTLVRRSFLLETGLVVSGSVLLGASLALWLAYQVALQVYVTAFPIPVWPVVGLLLGSSLVVGVATLFPARQAARLHPAEALRAE